jgi:putative heme-binding domain-containing protein
VGDYGFVMAEGTDGKSVQLRGCGIVRVRPGGSELEVVSRGQRNIYDVAISPTRDVFTRDNTKRYKKEDLVESILKPRAKIAQGFESQFVQTHEGKVYDGFVDRESGDEIEFRNIAGLATVLKKSDIEERGKREASIMPLGMADKLNVDQLAAILAYLESLKK